jgi:hypothetical protein
MKNQTSLQTNVEEKPQMPRKKYEKPAVIYLAPLEAMANVCIGSNPPYKQAGGPGCNSPFFNS